MGVLFLLFAKTLRKESHSKKINIPLRFNSPPSDHLFCPGSIKPGYTPRAHFKNLEEAWKLFLVSLSQKERLFHAKNPPYYHPPPWFHRGQLPPNGASNAPVPQTPFLPKS